MTVAVADPATDGAVDDKWRTFIGLLAVATLAPMLFYPFSRHFHPDAVSIVAISGFINLIGGTVHVGATCFFYADTRVRDHFRLNKWRYYAAPAFLTAATGLAFAFAGDGPVAYLMIGYFVWQTYHYQMQNYGILSFVAAATDRIRPSFLEKAVLQTSVWLGILGLIKVYGLAGNTVLSPFADEIHRVAGLAFWIVPALYVGAFCTQPGLRANPTRMAFLALGGLFYLPIFLFRDPISAVSGYALGHGLQYLVFMYFVSAGREDRDLRIIAITAISLAVGCLLALMADQALWGRPGKFVFGAYLGLVMAHFVVDAGVWKLREPFQRDYMRNAFGFVFGRK